MKNTDKTQLAPAVQAALSEYNVAINWALDAVQKLESICITKRLSEMFWVEDKETVEILQKDYLETA